jgi:type IV pilus assembly protein PilM
LFDNKMVSIDIGSKNIHIVVGKTGNGCIDIEKAFMLPTPTGSLLDGRLEDALPLKDAIRTALNLNKINSRNVSLVIQSSLVITKDLILPAANPAELANMVIYEMEQYLPVAAGEYNIQHKIIGELSEGILKKLRIRAAAMPKEISEKYYNFIKDINLKPEVLDIQFNSLAKLMSSRPAINGKQPGPDMTFAVLDMGNRNTGINIISKSKLDFSRLISFGGWNIDTSAANYYTLSYDKAEEKKIKEFRITGGFQSSADDKLKSVIDQWINEIQKVFQFYSSKGVDSKIDALYLHGGSSNLAGLSEYIEQSLNIPTYRIENLSNVRFMDTIGNFKLEYFINAIGAMIKN